MFQKLLARIARAFTGHGIPYMVIGGQATLLHGEPRLTRDVDITLGVDVEALARVRGAMQGVPLTTAVDEADAFVRRTNVLPMVDPDTHVRVDLIFSCTEYERAAIARGVHVPMDGVPVRFAAAEDLIIHKIVAGRPRDLEDVAGVLARGPSLDDEYMLRWLQSFRSVVDRDLVASYRSMQRKNTP